MNGYWVAKKQVRRLENQTQKISELEKVARASPEPSGVEAALTLPALDSPLWPWHFHSRTLDTATTKILGRNI